MLQLLNASVVIPCHNGADRIHMPLSALLAQDAREGSFEVIVVDNASTDATGRVASTHPAVAGLAQRGISCRVVREDAVGLAYARIRGVREARAGLVCFLDDDTAPAPDYVSQGIAALNDGTIGLAVSRVFPTYETDPPRSIMRREHLLAVNYKLGESAIDWGAEPTLAPTVGAGMWVRRDAFLSAVPWDQPYALLPDRRMASLGSGGDIEIGYLMGKAGFRRVYLPQLQLRHFIPTARLRSAYFRRLVVGIIRSEETLTARYLERRRSPFWRARALVGFVFACLACPYLLVRPDGLRDMLFVLASRWARVRGPFRESPRR
jgi:GT2 family glycosyltransferase